MYRTCMEACMMSPWTTESIHRSSESFHCSTSIVPVSNCHVEKTRVFQFGRISLNISLRDSVLKTKKHRAKVLISTSRIIFFSWKVLRIEFCLFHLKTTFSIGIYWCALDVYGVMYDVALHYIEYS